MFIDGNLTNTGTINIGSSRSLTVNGNTVTVTLNAGTIFLGTGTLSLTGGADLTLNADLTLPGLSAGSGSVISSGGSNAMTVSGSATFSSAIVNVAYTNEGTTTATSTTFSDTVTNQGTLTLISTNTFGEVFTNTADGTLILQSQFANSSTVSGTFDGGLSNAGTIQFNTQDDPQNKTATLTVTGTLTNTGLIETITNTSGTDSIVGDVDNSGTLFANGDDLFIDGNLTNTGTIDTATGRTLAVAGGGTFTNQSNGTVEGTGTLNVSAVTFTNDGALSPGGDGTVGTLSVTGNVAQSDSSVLSADIDGSFADLLAVNGSYAIDGTLDLNFLSIPSDDGSFVIATFDSIVGPLPVFDIVTDNLSGAFIVTPIINATNVTISLTRIEVDWNNGTLNGSWHTAGNWDLGFVPPDNTDVTITDQTDTVTYSTGTTVLNDLDLVGETLTVSGGTLTVEGEFTQGAGATLNLTGGTLNISPNTLTADGTIIFNGGTIQTSGTTTLDFRASSSNTLNDVTINGAVDLSASSAIVRVLTKLTLNTELGGSPGSLTLSGSGSIISFQGTQLFDNATVLFDATTGGLRTLAAEGSGTVLTLGSGVTISGGGGVIKDGVLVGGAATVINQGLILANVSGQSITIQQSNFDNEGTVEASGGGSLVINGSSFINDGSVLITGGGTLTISAGSWSNLETRTITATNSSLTLGGNWDNDGTITVTDSTVSLGGTFSTADIGMLTRSGGTVTLTGTIDNAADELTFDAASGSWRVLGGRINGGTVQFGDGEGLDFRASSSNTLNDVTINGAVDLSASSAIVRVLTKLTLNTELGGSPGSLTLSGSGSIISFQGTQLFDNATVLFDATTGGLRTLAAEGSGTVLTLGSGVTISGGGGVIKDGVLVGGAATVINQGLILANVSGQSITIQQSNFDNEGTITLANGGNVTMTVASADYTSSGTINVLGGGDLTINFSGTTPTFTNESGGVINIDDPAGSQLILNGDAADTFINAAGAEINGSVGIVNNGVTFTNLGTLNPGLSPGVMTIEGDLGQGDSAVLNIELAGTAAGSEHDQLVVTGEIEWNGTINVTLLDGFEPAVGDSFAIVSAASTVGELDHFGGLRFGDDMVLGTDFSDSGLTLTTLQASAGHAGGAGDDTLRGGLGDDVIIGNDGDDIIVGGGGADHLYGDAGDDLLVVGGTDFARIDGGTGNDTLAFDGDLDLGLIRGDQIEGIEEIDITGSGDNLLTLDAEDVRAITDGVNTKADDAELHAENSLVITGNAGDTVDLDQFSDTGIDTSVGGRAGYSVYASTDGSAQVIVANEVAVV